MLQAAVSMEQTSPIIFVKKKSKLTAKSIETPLFVQGLASLGQENIRKRPVRFHSGQCALGYITFHSQVAQKPKYSFSQ